MASIDLRDVSFRYHRKRLPVIDGVTATISPGVTGLIGANGAGKSTLLRLIAGYVRPTHGTIEIASADYPAGVAIPVGLIPETPLFEAHLTVESFLNGIAELAHCKVPERSTVLAGIWNERLGMLSLGQKRKVEIAAALICSPSVLLFDEPTNGLDPLALAELRETIRICNDGRRVIVISSHHLDELQRNVDYLLILNNGRIAGSWTREELAASQGSIEALFHRTVAPQGTGC